MMMNYKNFTFDEDDADDADYNIVSQLTMMIVQLLVGARGRIYVGQNF